MAKANYFTNLRLGKTGREAVRQNDLFQNFLKEGMTRKQATQISASIVSQFKGLKQQDLKKWREAHNIALNTNNPKREFLYEIYRDTLLDGHLKGAIKVRLEKMLKNNFNLKDVTTGSENKEATDLLNRSWFLQFMTLAWESNSWGHSLIQFGDLFSSPQSISEFEFCDVEIVNRDHVKPEFGIIVKNVNDEKGVSYREGPAAQWSVEVGTNDGLGFLLEASPQVISKKYMGIFWDEFAEMFAAPIRIGKTNTQNEVQRNQMADMLSEMGRNAWGVFDNNADIQIVETQQKDAYQVYDKRMERVDKEISKLILGNTMTTDDGSSKSQGEVHLGITEDIVDSDKRAMGFIINEKLIPFLIMHGYPLEGMRFHWDESEELSLVEQQKIDAWLVEHFEIEMEYFKTTYNSQITDFKKADPTTGGGGGNTGK